jgi:hypothetical protein
MDHPRPVTNVYVDGFNLYYALLKYSPHKWLDLDILFKRLRPDDGCEEFGILLRWCLGIRSRIS